METRMESCQMRGRLGSRRRVGTRRRRRTRRCGWCASCARSWASDHGTVQRVADQLGYGVESVRKWVKQADIDDGVRPGVTTAEDGADPGSSSRRTGSCAGRTRSCKSASAFFAAELDRPQK